MNLADIVIVLCNPAESGNIGAVCRAMKNMELSRLRIVGKRSDYDGETVKTRAVHSYDVWENAEFYSDLESAVNDCAFAAGTTRRHGQKRKGFYLLPEEFAQKVFSLPPPAGAVCKARAAAVFGHERTGLTDEELNLCSAAVTIPANPAEGSLNLSHAVQIIAYELYRKALPAQCTYEPVPLGRLKQTVAVVSDSLQRIGFFTLAGRNDAERFWLSVFARAGLSETEASRIEKIFVKAATLALKKRE